MTTANWCVLAASFMPIATIGLAKIASSRDPQGQGRYDNHQPREWAKSLRGWRQRARAAHDNGFEALPVFIAAVLLAQQAHASQSLVDLLALGFVSLRLAYVAAYLLDMGSVRTLVWTGAYAICVGLFALAA
ncbi:MAPEG family protein [Oxalobacteraceae bacterium]|nr:MAPEG family protein [Oxalobacteraceae bacterium]